MLMDFSTINVARIEKKKHYLVILLFVRGRGGCSAVDLSDP